MHHTRRFVGSPAKQPHNHRLLNHTVAALLRSPLHGLISRDLMLITFTDTVGESTHRKPAQSIWPISLANAEVRVCARGTSASQASARNRLSAIAVIRCWSQTFANPR